MTDTIDETLLSAGELAELIGLTANRINALAREGVIPRRQGKRFELREAISAYCAHLREGQTGRPSTHPDLLEEKARLTRAQADHAELKLAHARSELVDVAAVEQEWASVLRDVRAGLLAVPTRVQQRLNKLTAYDVSEIDREVREVLAGIAEDSHDA